MLCDCDLDVTAHFRNPFAFSQSSMTIRIRVDVGRLSSFAALSIAARTRVSKRTDVMTPDPALPTLAVFFGILASIYFSILLTCCV
jgi:hypothetical protein